MTGKFSEATNLETSFRNFIISFAPVIKELSDELQDKWRNHGNIADFKDLVEFVEDLETDARGTSDNPGVERYSLGVIDAGVAYVFATVL